MTIYYKKITTLALAVVLTACGAGPEVNSPTDDGSGDQQTPAAPVSGLPVTDSPETNTPVASNPTNQLSASEQRGKEFYESAEMQCTTCHGQDGQSTSLPINANLELYIHSSNLSASVDLATYIKEYMPQDIASPTACVGSCATDIAAYIKSWNNTDSTTPVSGNPVVNPGNPVVNPGNPVVNPGNPVVNPGNPVVNPGNPVVNPGNPVITPPVQVPVASKIFFEAEDFSAALDNESENLSGNTPTRDGVDLGNSDGNGLVVGYTIDGEWLEYKINVDVASNFAMSIRSASGASGGSVNILINERNVASGIQLPATSGWDDYTITSGVSLGFLPKGQHNVRIDIVKSGFNLDWFEMTPQVVAQPPVTPAPVNPAPVNPVPVDPAPVTPVPVDPAPVYVGSVEDGQRMYEANEHGCLTCHGQDFAGPVAPIDPSKSLYAHSRVNPNVALSLSDYIAEYMPTSNPAACVGECADDFAAYIKSRASTTPVATTPIDSNTSAFACNVGQDVTYGLRNVRLLTAREYENTLKDLLGFTVDASKEGVPKDTFIDGFTNQSFTAITQEYADAYASIAKLAAAFAASSGFNGVANCSNVSNTQCANRFVDEFAMKAFRRPLTNVEKQRYIDLFDNGLTQGDNNEGLKLAVETILNSPYFLMRSELGVKVSSLNANQIPDQGVSRDAYMLTPYEMATFLSYTFKGSMPDAELMQAAENNRLLTDSQILDQIDRLLATSKAREHFGEFAAQWFRTDLVLSRSKSEDLYPNFNKSIQRDMAQETREIFKHVMFDGNRAIGELFDNFTFVNRNLANYYGIAGNFNNSFKKAENLENRGGILASGSFMAGFANLEATSPIQRGVAVREDLMCQEVPPMPNDIADERDNVAGRLQTFIDQSGGSITNRERTHFLTKDAPCSDCHRTIINPQGFGLEDFNAAGLHRVTDQNNLNIDSEGQLIGLTTLADGQQRDFNGALGLSKVLKELPSTRSCYNQKAFRFAMGTGYDTVSHTPGFTLELTTQQKEGFSCAVNAMEEAMINNNDNPRAALRALGIQDIIKYRK